MNTTKKMFKIIIVYMIIAAVSVGIASDVTAYAASKSEYTCKKKVVDRNGDLINAQLSTDGKGDLNMIFYEMFSFYQLVTCGNGKSVTSKRLLGEEDFPMPLKEEHAERSNDVKLGKNGTIQFVTNVYKKKNDWREIFILTDSKGRKITSIDISKKMKSYNENPCKEDVEFGKDEVVDYEVTGKYLDVIIDEEAINSEEGHIYSVQRFNLKTGKRVRARKLERSCFAIMDGYLYGSQNENDYRNYKYSLDGKKCLWEMKQCDNLNGKWAIGDVKDNYIYYYNRKGIYILDMTDKGARPKKIISAKECPAIKNKYTLVKLRVDNINHIYLTVDFCNKSKMHIYEFTKK